MTSFVVDIKSRDVCVDVIRKYIRKQSTKSDCILILANYYYDYRPYINEYLPLVLADIVVEYSHEIYNINCEICDISNESVTKDHYIYAVDVVNNELNIDFELYLSYEALVQDLTIANIELLNYKLYDHAHFVNNYLSKKLINMHLNCYHSYDEQRISAYGDVIKRINHEQFISEIIVIESLYNQFAQKKIEK